MSRLATAGTSVALAGALVFGTAGTAQAEPAAAPAPAASTQVALAAADTTDPAYRNWCHRVWHKGHWAWWWHRKHWVPGYWSCAWWRGKHW